MRKFAIAVAVSASIAAPLDALPTVTNLTAPAEAPLFGKFEATFDVATAANPYWPYDVSPNQGVPAGVGVSVDGLFSSDNWQTTITQPAFYYQDYTSSDHYQSDRTWLYPNGAAKWAIRFAPTAVGPWKFRIRATDSTGTTVSEEASFTCIPSTNRGFVRVSADDPRYFVLSGAPDGSGGTFLPMIGLNYDTPKVSDMEAKYAQLQNMGVNLIRSWWQSSSWALPFFGGGGQGGDLVWHNVVYSTEHLRHPAGSGHIVSAKLTSLHNGPPYKGLFSNAWVKPSTRYRAAAWIKTVGITGSGASYGCYVYPTGRRLTGDNDWQEVSCEFTTEPAQYEAAGAVCMENVTGGAAYVSDVSLREVLDGGQLGPELLPRPNLQAHTSFQQPIAWLIDRLLEIASARGIYIRAVIEEKDDGFYGCIQPDGTWGAHSPGNVYADAAHACRTLQTYYWRYLIARWGYSTAIHSFELLNEGDPFDGTHAAALKALENYVNTHDPNRHLVSTSNWHSLPPEMWHAGGGCADLHMYVGWNVASGGHRIWPGWDGPWWSANQAADIDDLGEGFVFDTAVSHGGRRSLKITSPASPGEPAGGEQQSKLSFQCGVVPGHRVRVSAWVKASNYVQYPPPKDWMGQGLMLYFDTSGPGWLSSPGDLKVPNGTYDWRLVQHEFDAPAHAYCLGVTPRRFYTNSATPGHLWLDDIVIQDLDSNLILNYNGGFEYMAPESYDVAAAHCSYSRLARSFQLGKPVIRGEVGITHPQRFTNPYKGFSYSGEDQLLVDDVQGVWWRKWVWSHLDPGGLYEVYWMHHLPIARAFTCGKAFQAFMADIPLANGHYVDASPEVSDPAIRAIGQKDLADNRAHLWIDNANHTWKNVVDGANIPPASGTITLSGLQDGPYRIEWWDTSSGAVLRAEDVTCADGALSLQVSGLQSDIACKIRTLPSKGVVTLTDVPDTVAPGQVVTLTVQYTSTADTDDRDVVVRVNVPPQTDYVAGSAEASGGTWDPASNVVSWSVDVVGARQTVTRTFQARVK